MINPDTINIIYTCYEMKLTLRPTANRNTETINLYVFSYGVKHLPIIEA
jgi:hypothetical protein